MPLYDFQCVHCQGIFEQRLAMAQIGEAQLECQYCKQTILAKPLLTGRAQIQSKTKWRPQSSAEQLAGPLVTGPGTHKNAARNSVLHNCKGVNCSVCGL
ncbi:putative FmdB family regulatory protein [Acinetobacter calcoaceticus]|uniref:Putative FmdB family regulatory protein n=1 Tax=Acinetobacter calcoaceticus TaxID=471 RepID=A0A4R1XXV4_ACICA|nr:putative FmdB family regulatory protein [Acinetobacter calcoaceticus]